MNALSLLTCLLSTDNRYTTDGTLGNDYATF